MPKRTLLLAGKQRSPHTSYPFPTATIGTTDLWGPGFTTGAADQYYALYDRRQGYNYPTDGTVNNVVWARYNVLRMI